LFRFILTVLLVAAVLAGSVLLFVPEQPSFLFQTSFFLLFTTITTYRYLQRATNPEDFVRLYLGMVVLKLMMGLGYALVMVMTDRASAAGNVVYFLISYFLFTAIEVGFLYRDKNR
jgi:uncharacterized membrane protein YjjP (DUF1212 family)